MKITVPELSLVVLIGASGSGKSTFARTHFKATEVLSSDCCRGLVADDQNAQDATKDAFEVLHFVAAKRLARGRLTVIDATNVQPEARAPLLALARQYHVLTVAIVLNLPEKVCQEHNSQRADRAFGPHVVRNQSQQLRRSLRGLEREGLRHVYTLGSPEAVAEATVERQRLLDDGKLVVAHAGLSEDLQGRTSGRVRSFALYGETTGESDEFGLPVRYNWAADYRGKAMVVYGHTPVPEPQWLNDTINIDTGCVFGGRLTALRYPEREFVSVAACEVYAAPARPFQLTDRTLSAQQQEDDVLDIEDVSGKRVIATRLIHNVTIREANATAALEVMSRFAANPKWLIYLPPTMSPSETTSQPGLLEHAAEAFAYYRNLGVGKVVCEEKHMGSRAVVVVCRDESVARPRFGIAEAEGGICYTRTGRRFFDDLALEAQLLEIVRQAANEAGFWEEFNTDWLCLDGELMPWSAKAQELVRQQYAAVGAASRAALGEAVTTLTHTANGSAGNNNELLQGVATLRDRYAQRLDMAAYYQDAYRRYCWAVRSIDDLRLAPFHLLATEGAVHTGKDHVWHMETLARLCGDNHSSLLLATPYQVVDTNDAVSQAAGTAWWEELTGRGGEGMVVKPLDCVVLGKRGLVQPAVKCRGREYLRIIYGPEYTAPENLDRLRSRGLSTKRALALREFALGLEALERFVRHEPLRHVHECVFGVLALESEPVDPRL